MISFLKLFKLKVLISENVYRCRGESELPLMFFYHKKIIASDKVNSIQEQLLILRYLKALRIIKIPFEIVGLLQKYLDKFKIPFINLNCYKLSKNLLNIYRYFDVCGKQ